MDYRISEPRYLRNLEIFPIAGEDGGTGSPLILDDVIPSGRASFREADVPEVDRIVFENRGDEPVFMLDGEEITGSLQNRIITASRISQPRAVEKVGVVCVEENRWDEIGGFQTGSYSYPRIRSILVQSRGRKNDLQQVIWQEVDRKITVTRTRSATSSMHDVYLNLQDEIERYLEGFESLNHGTVGFVAACGNRILGADLFGSKTLYRKLERKMIRSYALDAIEFRRPAKGDPGIGDFLVSFQSALSRGASRRSDRSSALKTRILTGRALYRGRGLVHASAFPN
jgi:hypothetical protein